MKKNISIIQPDIHITFKKYNNKDVFSPCHMHIYDAMNVSTADKALLKSLRIMPSSNCIWIIAYNTPDKSKFICAGSQIEEAIIDISGYKNYFIAVFDSNIFYYNKGAAREIAPADMIGSIIDFKPDESCPEFTFIKNILNSTSFDSKCTAFAEYIKGSKTLYRFNPDVLKMSSIIAQSDSECSLTQLSEETGYSCRHINRLFNKDYGFGPKAYIKFCRFQKVLNEILSDSNRQNSQFIQNIGYSDQAYFQHEFKAFMGETPKQFIKRLNQ